MYCLLCGKNLYTNITFQNLFQINHFLHDSCEKHLKKSDNYIAYPLLDKLVYIDYLFEERMETSKDDTLFLFYGHILFERLLNNDEWSLVIFTEKKIEHQTIVLLVELAEKVILFCSIFHENFM